MPGAPLSPRRAGTQTKLLDAAVGVFADRGVIASSVEEICERAGFTRGAFYSNYSSKDELVLALVDRALQDRAAGVSEVVANGTRDTLSGTREQIIAGSLGRFLTTQNTTRDWVLGQAEIRLHAVREPAVSEAYRRYRDASHAEMVETLRSVQQAFGMAFAFPLEEAIEFIDPTYQSCTLDAFMLPEARGVTDLAELAPEVLERAMRPLLRFLQVWITGLAGAEPDA